MIDTDTDIDTDADADADDVVVVYRYFRLYRKKTCVVSLVSQKWPGLSLNKYLSRNLPLLKGERKK